MIGRHNLWRMGGREKEGKVRREGGMDRGKKEGRERGRELHRRGGLTAALECGLSEKVSNVHMAGCSHTCLHRLTPTH